MLFAVAVRALHRNYRGPLYQVTRASDGAAADIGVLETGGYADAAAQNSSGPGPGTTPMHQEGAVILSPAGLDYPV